MVETLHYSLSEVAPYISWTYFFHAWGIPLRMASVAQLHQCPSCRAQWLASFPDGEQEKAREAMQLYDDATALLRHLEGHVQGHALVGLFEANGDGEDIIIYKRGKGQAIGRPEGATLAVQEMKIPLLRQQHGDECLCWADFLRPLSSGRRDTVGVFATSVDEEMVHDQEASGQPTDDYRQMLGQTLADRLAEATAERMHEEVRRRLWGYAPDERLTPEDMFQERYVGRRPAVGYPSLPDQSLNFLIDRLLGLRHIGISLTESGAMRPHASTSGLIFAHPRARHFAIGHIGDDQLRNYARRRGLPLGVVRHFLAANLPNLPMSP